MKKVCILLILILTILVGCSNIPDESEIKNDNFCYLQLSGNEKKVYDTLCAALNTRQSKIEENIGNLNVQDFDKVYQAVVCDHPEYFWVTGAYTYSSGAVIGKEKVSGVEPEYALSDAEFESKKAQFDNAVNQILSKCVLYSNDYDKAVYLHDVIVGGTDYVDDGDFYNATAFGAIVNKKAICAGYSKAYKLLLNKAGIKCEYVTGTLSEGEGHAWNIVTIQNENFWVDITLDDPVFLGANNSGVSIFYNYFGLTDEQFFNTHTLSDNFSYPKCESEDYNYYKKNGLYISGGDISATEQIIKSAYSNGKAVALIKFSDMSALDSVKNSIFNGNRIFEIIGKRSSVSYSVDSNNCLMIIKLR